MVSDDQPAVSAIITCYNLERYIALAIQSVLDQTHGAAEIIVVDDASTDGSRDRIAAFGDAVRLIALDRNEGVLGATLAGIGAARGEVLAFLDGDDLWRPGKVERVATAFAADPRLVLLSHDYAIVDESGKPTGAIDDTKRNTRRLVAGHLPRAAMSERLKESITGYRGVWLGSAFSIRRTALDLAELERFIASVSILQFRRLSYQDHLLAQFVIVTQPDGIVGFLDKELFEYRVFSGNTSGLSDTREAALRTLRRAQVNVLGTQRVIAASPRFHPQLRRQMRMADEFRYMTALYMGRTFTAIGIAIRLAITFWAPRRTVKELFRLSSVALLGSDRFFRMKTARRSGTPPTID